MLDSVVKDKTLALDEVLPIYVGKILGWSNSEIFSYSENCDWRGIVRCVPVYSYCSAHAAYSVLIQCALLLLSYPCPFSLWELEVRV